MSILLCNTGLLAMGGLASMSTQEPRSHTHQTTATAMATAMATGRSVVLFILSTAQKTTSKAGNLAKGASTTTTARSVTALLILSTTKEASGKIGNLTKSTTTGSVTLLVLPAAT